MQVIEDLVYRLVADASSLEGSLKKAESQIQKSVDKVASEQEKRAKKAELTVEQIKENALADWKKTVQKAVDQNNDYEFRQRYKTAKKKEAVQDGALDRFAAKSKKAVDQINDYWFKRHHKTIEHEESAFTKELNSAVAIGRKTINKANQEIADEIADTRKETIKKSIEEWQRTIDRQTAAIKEAENIQNTIDKEKAARQALEEETEQRWLKNLRMKEIQSAKSAEKIAKKESEIDEKKRIQDQKLYEEGFRLGEKQHDQEKKNIEDSYLLKQQLSEKQAEQEKNDDLDKASRFRRMLDERDAAIKKAAEKQKHADEVEELRKKKALERHERDEAEARRRRIREEKRADEQIYSNRKRLLSMLNMLLVSVGVPRFYKSIVKEASNALEANNKLRAVFTLMTDEAKAAAKELSDFYGVSTTNARSMLADTGNILTNFGIQQDVALQMSAQINKLGADLASFVNYQGGAAGAANALTKALLGEREAAKALGVAITENDVKDLAKSYGLAVTGLNRQSRALLTLQVMLKQTRNAQGDFERSSHDLENQTRILNSAFDDLKLALGEEIIPLVIKAVGATTNIVRTLTDADPIIHKIILILPGLALGIKGVGLAMKFVDTIMQGSVLSLMSVAFVGLSVAITGVLYTMEKYRQKVTDLSDDINRLSSAMQEKNRLDAEAKKYSTDNTEAADTETLAMQRRIKAQQDYNAIQIRTYALEAQQSYTNNIRDLKETEKLIKQKTMTLDAYSYALADTNAAQREYETLLNKGNERTEEETEWQRQLFYALNDVSASRDNAYNKMVKYNEELTEYESHAKTLESTINIALNNLASSLDYDIVKVSELADKVDEDLYGALVKVLIAHAQLIQGDSIEDILSAANYKTRDWVSLLEKVDKALVSVREDSLKSEGNLNQVLTDRLQKLRDEKELYEAAIQAREQGIIKENNGNEELAKDTIEWKRLQDDRVNMNEFYEKAELAVIEYYTNEKEKEYDKYLDKYREFTKKMANTRKERLAADKADVTHQYEEMVKSFKSSADITATDEMEANIFMAAKGDTSVVENYYNKLSDAEKAYFDEAVKLRKSYLDRMSQLDAEYETDVHKSKLEADIRDLGIDTGNERKNYENRKKALEKQRDLELADVTKTEADKYRIRHNYADQIAALNREEEDRLRKLRESGNTELMQSEIKAGEARLEQLKKQQEREVKELRSGGKEAYDNVESYWGKKMVKGDTSDPAAERMLELEMERKHILEQNRDLQLEMLKTQKEEEERVLRTQYKEGDPELEKQLENLETVYRHHEEEVVAGYEEAVLDIVKEHEDGIQTIKDYEEGWQKKYLKLTKGTFALRREQLEEEKKLEIKKAEEKGAAVENIEKYYAKKAADLDKEIADERLSYEAKRRNAYGVDTSTIGGMWTKHGGWEQRKRELLKMRNEELSMYVEDGPEYEKKAAEWGHIIGKNFADNVISSVEQGLGYLAEITSAIESLMTRFSENQIQGSEDRLAELERQRDNNLKNAQKNEDKMTRAQKDEMERRRKMDEEEIERQKSLIKAQKEDAFRMQKAFAITEATITGIQATIDAYQSGAQTHWALGAVAAAAAASFVGAQIAAIASQPMPSYAVGAYDLPQDQVAQVHQGEMIVPKPFAQEIRENGGLGGQGIVVNVYGTTDDVSVEESESEEGKMKQIDIYMNSKVKQMVMTGQLDAPLQTRFELNRRGRRA